MKKIISILLVAALLLGMSAFATDVDLVEEIEAEEVEVYEEETLEYYDASTPASKAYFFKSFNDYSSAEDYVASLADIATIDTYAKARAYAQEHGTSTVWTSNPTKTSLKFKENAFGHMGIGSASGTATLQVIPEETWNYLQNTDEYYVISMDISADPVAKKTNYTVGQIFMANAYDEENDVAFETPASQVLKWFAHNITAADSSGVMKTNVGMGNANHETGVQSLDIYPGQTSTFAYAFHNAGEGKDDDNKRRIVIDTTVKTNDQLIDRRKPESGYPYATGMIGKDTIGGYRWLFDSTNGVYLADLKIYTVKESVGSFHVKMDETYDIPSTVDSVKVKFSQPVAKKAVSASSFTVTENGSTFTDYKVGKLTTYVDETTGEIGSEVELTFPYGLKSSSTYEVTVNSAIKNEIQKLSLGEYNTVSFTTAAAPNNTVSISGIAGLEDSEGADAVTALEVNKQAKFTAEVTDAADASYILLGIYDSSDNLVSYTYAKVNQGEKISLASKIEVSGMKVKAFSAGNLLDLEAFSSDATIE